MTGRQAVLMAGAFGLTFALLAGTFLALQGMARDPDRPLYTPDPSLVALASLPAGTAKPAQTRHPAGTPPPSGGAPTARPQTTRPSTPSRKPTAEPSDAASAAPTDGSAPSPGADGTVRVVVPGSAYDTADLPAHGTLTPLAGGGVKLETTRMYSEQLMVTWYPPSEAVPADRTITRVDVAVCGKGDGDFYETYGPLGAEPPEHEVEPPSPDGCWHYENAYGDDLSVIAITRLGSWLVIDRVEYTLFVE